MILYFIRFSEHEQHYDYQYDPYGALYEKMDEKSMITIEIQNTPTIRYIRNVSFTRLDYVVTIGGIMGLFFGASILGLFEIVYIWLIRRF